VRAWSTGPGLTDLKALAAAEDRRDAVPVGRLDLRVDDRVVLGVVLPALAVTDRDVGAAELGEEGPADLTGVGTGVVHREVLRAELELEAVPVDEGLHAA
jgi:hypothetical protein